MALYAAIILIILSGDIKLILPLSGDIESVFSACL